ncbi:unnamed protein product [Brachionus calyciflorus]|uniref:Uncharacterized protein n=1 Tax=Brachionus calyciflorus TaxID=104777 RepID=A0A813SIZ6_9BILA|nr:unnamed protein product [Brachionus calyciflorus]
MKFLKIKILQISLVFILEKLVSTEWITKMSSYFDTVFFENTILIHEFSTPSRLKCIQKCILFETTCQFLQFTLGKRCELYSSIQKEIFNGNVDIYLRDKKLPRIHFLNGSFLDRLQIFNMAKVSFNLSRNGINQIVPLAFATSNKTETLDLSFNNLTILYSKSFYGMINLKTLDLSFNQISQFESDVFKENSSLAFLHLENNFLKYLNGNIFDNLQWLRLLNLECNQIEVLDTNTFKNLKNIRKIYLGNNNLKSLDPFFHNLELLSLLDISFNKIKTVHKDAFMSRHNLSDILISNNQISEINSETFKGVNYLEKLDLSSNRIQKIDVNFTSNFPNLKELHMSNNNLSFIETRFFNGLEKLEILKLYNCNIRNIDLNSLKNLKVLHLGANKITLFSQNLSSLTELLLTGNPLGNLTYPLISSQNSNLDVLGISNCKLEYIDFDILKNLTNLRTLGITGNQLVFNNETFNGFRNLENVYIDQYYANKFKTVFPNIRFSIL